MTLRASAATDQVQTGAHLVRTSPPTTMLPTPAPATRVISSILTGTVSKSRVLLDAILVQIPRATAVSLV